MHTRLENALNVCRHSLTFNKTIHVTALRISIKQMLICVLAALQTVQNVQTQQDYAQVANLPLLWIRHNPVCAAACHLPKLSLMDNVCRWLAAVRLVNTTQATTRALAAQLQIVMFVVISLESVKVVHPRSRYLLQKLAFATLTSS